MTDSRQNSQADNRRKRVEKKRQEAELIGEMLFGSLPSIPQMMYDEKNAVTESARQENQYVNLGQHLASPENRTWGPDASTAEVKISQPVYARSPKTEVRRDAMETLEDFPELASMKNDEIPTKNDSPQALSEKEGFIAMEKVVLEKNAENSPAPLGAPESMLEKNVLTGEKDENIRFGSATLTSSILSAAAEPSERNVFHKYALQITSIGASVLIIFVMAFVLRVREAGDSSVAETPKHSAVDHVAGHSHSHPTPVTDRKYENVNRPSVNFPQAAGYSPENVQVVTAAPAAGDNDLYFDADLAYTGQYVETAASYGAEIPVYDASMAALPSRVNSPQASSVPSYVTTPVPPQPHYTRQYENSYQDQFAAGARTLDYSPTDELPPYYNPSLGGTVNPPAMEENVYASYDAYEKMVAGKAEMPAQRTAASQQPSYVPRKLAPPPRSSRNSQAPNTMTAAVPAADAYAPLEYPNPTPMSVADVSPSFGASVTHGGDYPTFDPSYAPTHPASGTQVTPSGGNIPVTENYIGNW